METQNTFPYSLTSQVKPWTMNLTSLGRYSMISKYLGPTTHLYSQVHINHVIYFTHTPFQSMKFSIFRGRNITQGFFVYQVETSSH